jgi:hypothetical protein
MFRRAGLVHDVAVRRMLIVRLGRRFGFFLSAESGAARASHVRRLTSAAGHPAFVRRRKGTKGNSAHEHHEYEHRRQKNPGDSCVMRACVARYQKQRKSSVQTRGSAND